MFFKTALTFLAIGALSVNAFTVPVARSPAPEPDSQELEAWMLKRDLSYDLFSRELQALEELFSRGSDPMPGPRTPVAAPARNKAWEAIGSSPGVAVPPAGGRSARGSSL